MANPKPDADIVCSVEGCRNTNTQNSTMTFFRLPARVERRRDWLRLMGREDLTSSKTWPKHRICEIHFSPQLFQDGANPSHKILKKFALPTLFMPVSVKEDKGTDPYIAFADAGISTDDKLSTSKTDNTTQTIKIKDDMKAKSLRFQILCDKFLSKEMAQRVKAQMLDVQLDGESSLQVKEECPSSKRIKFEEDIDDFDIKDVIVKTETFFN